MQFNRSIFFALAGLSACIFTFSARAQDHQHQMTEPSAAQVEISPDRR